MTDTGAGAVRSGGGATNGEPQRLGDRLVSLGLITADQLRIALHEQRERSGGRKMLGNTLVELGFMTESTLAAVLAERTGLNHIDLTTSVLDAEVVQLLPKRQAQLLRAIPVAMDPGSVKIAMADPYDVMAIDQLRRVFPRNVDIVPLVSGDTEIMDAIDQYYGYEMSIDGILREMETGEFDPTSLEEGSNRYLHPVVRLVNALVLDGVKSGASDLHFEPEQSFVRLRLRIDGVLVQVQALHKDHWPAISHRLKIMSKMNIADTRSVQDGRFTLNVGNREVDFRVSLLPTVYGENIVIRVLDHARSLQPLDSLGFSEGNIDQLRRLLKRPEGIVIITGPTGSGKTTTLYSMLREISSVEVNIMTLEDPVEFQLPLIRQTQVHEQIGLTFAQGIRTMLRQDPDIVFVGEMRDDETAQMALRAGMTGHQVFSTLHTNDAVGVIPRLIDLGLKPSMLAGNIICAIAQRLARRLCPDCRETRTATADECRLLGVDPAAPPTIGKAVGCPACRGTGYRGRVAIAELLRFTSELDDLITASAPRSAIIALAREQGFVSMAEDGIRKVLLGDISVESLIRAVDVTARL